MSENAFRAMWTLIVCVVVTVLVSLVTKPVPESKLANLVYGLTPLPKQGEAPLLKRPILWATVVGIAFILVNIIFW